MRMPVFKRPASDERDRRQPEKVTIAAYRRSTRLIAPGLQYQIVPASSALLAFAARNKIETVCQGATSISTSWGVAVGPATGRSAVGRLDEIISSSRLLKRVDATPFTTGIIDRSLLGPEWQGPPAPQERRKGRPSRCYHSRFTLGEPKHRIFR
jgi:hypothetical protein